MRLLPLAAQISRIVFALSFVITVSGLNFSPLVQLRDQQQVKLDQFDMLTTNSGWVLIGLHLFWTYDAGQVWNEISPSIPPDGSIQAVEFIDSNIGWMLWTTANSDGSANFQLAHTLDNGKTWATRALSLFESGEIASYAEKAQMGWFDAQRGWISVKQNSGSNFSMGTLFTTSDGGSSWRRFTLPVANKIYFSDPQNGWAVGGPTNDQVFNTQDAGATWKNVSPTDLPDGIQAIVSPPFISNERGLLVIMTLGMENNLKVYSLENPVKWLPMGQIKLDVQPGLIGLSFLDAQNFVAVVPNTTSIVRVMDGELNVLNNRDGLSASIVELDMVSLDVGWAKSIDSSCVTASLPDPETASVSCSVTTRLLQTNNGGVTWQNMNLPVVQSDIASLNPLNMNDTVIMNTISNSETSMEFVGQGFERCEIPTLSQMQTWQASSPYKTVN